MGRRKCQRYSQYLAFSFPAAGWRVVLAGMCASLSFVNLLWLIHTTLLERVRFCGMITIPGLVACEFLLQEKFAYDIKEKAKIV